MAYTISCYNGAQHPAKHPSSTAIAPDLRSARKVAAGNLGCKSLRGASTWDRYQGGTVYQFGPRTESNENDFVVIEEL